MPYQQMVADGTIVEVTDWDQYIASINNGTVAGVINGCWIMASIVANDDQSGQWAITNMPKLDDVEGATNYSNNGGSSWAITTNCQKTDLAIDFMNSTFAGSTELYDDIISKGALATWAPAGDSEVYAQPVEFFSNEAVYAKIVDFATKTPSNVTGAFYYDARDAVGVALSNIIQSGADMDSEIANAQDTVDKITKNFKRGLITEEERYKEVVETWKATDDALTKALLDGLDKYNNIFMMADSGARGSDKQIKQLAGMRGLMADTTGHTIELPIKSNFREGLDVLEYFMSAHGARKGMSDTALRTADSGYLTRRLVDVSQELIIHEVDCAKPGAPIPGMYTGYNY